MNVTSVVQGWAATPSTNYGFVLLANGSDTNTVLFHSREATDATKRPQLLIAYRVPQSTACSPTVLDQFTTVSYSNNDGTALWAGPWVEGLDNITVGGDGPAAGRITVAGGVLSFVTENAAAAANQNVYREANLTGASAATLTFNAVNSIDAAGNTIVIEASNNGGASYTVLETFSSTSNTGANAFSKDLVAALGSVGSQTRIRIRQNGTAANDNKVVTFDNVQIQWTVNPSAGATSSLTATPTLVKNGDTVTIVMTVTSPSQMTNIAPTTPAVANVVGGAGCTGFAPATQTPQNIGAGGGSVNFTWTCTADDGTTVPASVAFTTSATATDQYGLAKTFSTTTSNSVLEPAVLTFQVTANNPATTTSLVNRGVLKDSTVYPNGVPSNPVTTPVERQPGLRRPARYLQYTARQQRRPPFDQRCPPGRNRHRCGD